MDDHLHNYLHRQLNDDVTTPPTASPTPEFQAPPSDGNDAEVLRNTVVSYGGLFLIMLTLFCYLRRKYPKVYNLRNWVPELQTPLAEKSFGSVSWMWKLLFIPDSEMLEECGMDALCFARVMEFGFKLSAVGMCLAVWLMPVYKTARQAEETAYVQDPIVELSVSHLPSGSNRFIATVLGCYCVFGYAMYNILKEFEWFILFRHQYLAKKRARNYAVYVQCIPQEYRTKAKLLRFFQQSHEQNSILDVHIAVKLPSLKKKVAARDKIVTKLEHAINVEVVTGIIPMERRRRPAAATTTTDNNNAIMGSNLVPPQLLMGETVNMIDALFEDLREANESVRESIERIEKTQNDEIAELRDQSTLTGAATPRQENHYNHNEPLLFTSYQQQDQQERSGTTLQAQQEQRQSLLSSFMGSLYNTKTPSNDASDTLNTMCEDDSPVSEIAVGDTLRMRNGQGSSLIAGSVVTTIDKSITIDTNNNSKMSSNNESIDNGDGAESRTTGGDSTSLVSSLVGGGKAILGVAAGAAALPTQGVKTLAATAVNLIAGEEDGTPMGAAFVTFTSLRATQTTLQMIQYPEPFAMEVMEAPDPDDVFWQNVGKDHKELQFGKLLSFGLTTALCLLWTIPMATISTMSTIEGLRGEVGAIDRLLVAQPWLEPVFAQLAPLLIVLAKELLVVFLEYLSMLEGPVSGAVVQSSLFTKLASFMIIQKFFVTAISGSVVAALSDMIETPTKIIDLLGTSLPTQSTFFIQILLVDTFLPMGLELLRVTAVATAAVRKMVGPNLTEKEQNTTWMGLRPLADPTEFEHASLLSGTVLYFMVYFVYATIAPITNFFLALCFLLMAAGYRHQFVYIYPTFPDSGGKLYVNFIRLLPNCMLIAQLAIVGMLALKKAAIASSLMTPLLVVTVLFKIYINQKHFAMAEHLPARDCLAADLRNASSLGHIEEFDFVRNKYIQPELREKQVIPENATVDQEIAQGIDMYLTPPASEAGVGDGTHEEAEIVFK